MVDRVNSEERNYSQREFSREKCIVEKVVGKKVRAGQIIYLVKWLNNPESNFTWEQEDKLVNLKEFVRDYEEQCQSGKFKKDEKKVSINKDRGVFPPEGNLITDRPNEIVKVKLKENSLYVKIAWCPRVSGITPKNSSYPYEEVWAKFPHLLLGFYEKRITVGDKQMSNLVNKNLCEYHLK